MANEPKAVKRAEARLDASMHERMGGWVRCARCERGTCHRQHCAALLGLHVFVIIAVGVAVVRFGKAHSLSAPASDS